MISKWSKAEWENGRDYREEKEGEIMQLNFNFKYKIIN